MQNNEERLIRLFGTAPIVIYNLLFILIGLAVYSDEGFYAAAQFIFKVYITCISVVTIYKRFILNNLILSDQPLRKKYVIQLVVLVMSGLLVSIILGVVITARDGMPPLPIALLIWIAFTIIGILLISSSAYTKHYFEQKIVSVRTEAEKVQAELDLLKSQINPHFLFNTLNNIYGLVHMNDKRAPEMISKLSSILRYLLYDCGESRVNLRKEKGLIEDYLQLQALKSNSIADRIDFYVDGILDQHVIMPMLLINFVENSFKHSDIDVNEKGWVSISLEVTDNQLHFKTKNTIKKELSNKTGFGIGLTNTKKMLEADYKDKHSLETSTDEDNFEVDLKVELS